MSQLDAAQNSKLRVLAAIKGDFTDAERLYASAETAFNLSRAFRDQPYQAEFGCQKRNDFIRLGKRKTF